MSLCSFAALRKDAQALLALISTLPRRAWEQKLHKIFVSDPVQGPLAVAWMLQQVFKASRWWRPLTRAAVAPVTRQGRGLLAGPAHDL